jgi:hypothetical protein
VNIGSLFALSLAYDIKISFPVDTDDAEVSPLAAEG